MPTISLLTPVVDGSHHYLGELYASIVKQELPGSWEWQWVVQEDGDTGRPLAGLPDDPRISAGTSTRGRAATARTLALGRATGLLVRAVDADDILTEGALLRDITTLLSNPGIAWCVSATQDLLSDGTLRPGPRDPDPGPLPEGFLASGEAEGLLQVVGTTLCTYTELVRALGGWQALPREEDVALLLAVEAMSKGWMIGEVGLLYRRWGGNTTEYVDNRLPSAATACRSVILDRVLALKNSGWRWSPPETR